MMVVVAVMMVIIIIIIIIGGGGGSISSIYNCIPETNHVSRVHTTDAVLQLQFMVHVMSHPTLNVLCIHTTTFQRQRERESVCARAHLCSAQCVCFL